MCRRSFAWLAAKLYDEAIAADPARARLLLERDVLEGALEAHAARLRERPEVVDFFATSVPELSLFGIDPAAALARAGELTRLAADGRRRVSKPPA